eukprot:TRINITY_DN25090_c0_g1_i1.p1 TRINITY_DN25090_c0_g1~~TRINITY_DN25090_c0_g1_i1.p1  ORF type:complete len:717 (+),score=-15.27 TRINITY_DN25090_c0_g1_i1:192-2153(+)
MAAGLALGLLAAAVMFLISAPLPLALIASLRHVSAPALRIVLAVCAVMLVLSCAHDFHVLVAPPAAGNAAGSSLDIAGVGMTGGDGGSMGPPVGDMMGPAEGGGTMGPAFGAADASPFGSASPGPTDGPSMDAPWDQPAGMTEMEPTGNSAWSDPEPASSGDADAPGGSEGASEPNGRGLLERISSDRLLAPPLSAAVVSAAHIASQPLASPLPLLAALHAHSAPMLWSAAAAAAASNGTARRRLQLTPAMPASPAAAAIVHRVVASLTMHRLAQSACLLALVLFILLRLHALLPLAAAVISATARATWGSARSALCAGLLAVAVGVALLLPLAAIPFNLVGGCVAANIGAGAPGDLSKCAGVSVLALLLLLPLLLLALWVLQVLAAAACFVVAAVYAQVYCHTGGRGDAHEGEAAASGLQGEVKIFKTALGLAATSSLGSVTAAAFALAGIAVAQAVAGAAVGGVLGGGVLGGLVQCAVTLAAMGGNLFVQWLVLPMCAVTGHGFQRAWELSLDVVRRYWRHLLAVNGAACCLVVPLAVAIMVANALLLALVFGVGVASFGMPGGPSGAVLVVALLLALYILLSVFGLLLCQVPLAGGVPTTLLCFVWDRRVDADALAPPRGRVEGGQAGDGRSDAVQGDEEARSMLHKGGG